MWSNRIKSIERRGFSPSSAVTMTPFWTDSPLCYTHRRKLLAKVDRSHQLHLFTRCIPWVIDRVGLKIATLLPVLRSDNALLVEIAVVGCTTLKMSNWMGGWASHSPFHSPYHRRRLQRRVRIVNNWMTLNALHVWLPTYNYPFGIRPRCGR